MAVVSQSEMPKGFASPWCRCEWFIVMADYGGYESETSQCYCNGQHFRCRHG